MNPLPILRDAWYFFSRHLPSLILLCLPLILLEVLAQQGWNHYHGGTSSPLSQLLIGLLFYPLYSAVLIRFLDARSRGDTPTAPELWSDALRLWPRFAVLAGLSSALVMLGGALYVLPALFVMVKLAFSEYLLVLRDLSPLEAMKQSYRLTRGRFGSLLVLVVCTMVPLWLLNGWVDERLGDSAGLAAHLLLDGAVSFLQLFPSVVLFRAYMLQEAR
jgi:hypothetical protein